MKTKTVSYAGLINIIGSSAALTILRSLRGEEKTPNHFAYLNYRIFPFAWDHAANRFRRFRVEITTE